MNNNVLGLLTSAFLFSLLVPARSMAQEWTVDPAHSGVMFEITHIFSTIRGRFSDFSANVSFDPQHPEKSRFEFVVKTDSIDTQIAKRDAHLKTADFFEAAKYPQIVFKSTKVARVEVNRFLLEGKMTVKDVTQDMQVELLYLGKKENPMSKGSEVAGLETRFKIDRLAFHVGDGKFYKMGVVGKDVQVLVSLEMARPLQ